MMDENKLINDGYRKYTGENINVFFNGDICTHSANCVKSNSKVFNLKNKPWINADAASAEEIRTIIDNCPSGALQYIK